MLVVLKKEERNKKEVRKKNCRERASFTSAIAPSIGSGFSVFRSYTVFVSVLVAGFYHLSPRKMSFRK